MTPEQKAKLAALIQEMRANHREKDRTIAKMLRIVLQVLANPRHKDKAELPAVLRDMITMLEEEDNIT
jgi:hypothetical protein